MPWPAMVGPRFARGPRDRLETLHPGYFALVMATGIVALAARLHGVPLLPAVLYWLNAGFLAALATATVLRIRRYPRAFAADLASHSRGVGFFTLVAACGVFGSQSVIQQGAVTAGLGLWAATALLWALILYGVLALLTVKPDKPSLAAGINGGWLVSVVATQSLAILTVTLLGAGALAGLRQPLMFAALVLWLGGGALYLWLMTLIFFRYTFLPMAPEDLTPPYWINMGAVAISTLGGAVLLEQAALSPTVTAIIPFVKGLTLFFWAIGSWWIPMLVVLGVWRYLIRGVAFAYDPLYWGGVFPLGMYSVATGHLAADIGAPFLMRLSQAFMAIALAAWLATFAGLVDSLLNAPRTQPRETAPTPASPRPGALCWAPASRPGERHELPRPAPPADRRHPPRDRRRPLPRRHRRLCRPRSRRQCDRRRRRRRARARRRAERSRQHRRRRADPDLQRRDARGPDDRRARAVAEGARPRILPARARRQDPARRAAHRRAGRPRRLDHGARGLGHDAVRRGRGGGDPAGPRRLPDVPADGREPCPARPAAAAMAVKRGRLSAGGAGARGRRDLPPERSGRRAAIHGRRGARRRLSRRPQGRAGGGARGLLSRRHRGQDPRLLQRTGRPAGGRRPRRIPLAGRAGAAPPLRRSRGLHLRPLVPGAGAAADPGAAGRQRPAGPRPQQRRLHPPPRRGAQTRLRRPRGQ